MKKSLNRMALWMCSVLILPITMLGCQSGYRSHVNKLAEHVRSGDYVSAAEVSAQGADKNKNNKKHRVAYNLEAARTSQLAGDIESSINYYDLVTDDVKPYLSNEAEAKVTEGVATTVVNQTISIYRATPAERIMSSTLNATNHLIKGDFDSARRELVMAHAWQEDAKDKYAKEISERQDELAAESKKEKMDTSSSVDKVLNDSSFDNLRDLTGYADYQNPFASHLRGVFLMACGANERNNAYWFIKRTLELSPSCSPAVSDDYELLAGAASEALPPTTWVYFMTGEAPHFEELRLDLPIPGGQVNYIAAAFPVLKMNDNYVPGLVVSADNEISNSSLLVDMDRVIANEFNERKGIIIAQEILSTVLKTIATNAAANEDGMFGLIAMGYQAASTSADLRSWHTLPKQVHLNRLETPKDGKVTLATYNGVSLGDVFVIPGEDNVIFVTLPSINVPASILTAQLSGK